MKYFDIDTELDIRLGNIRYIGDDAEEYSFRKISTDRLQDMVDNMNEDLEISKVVVD